MLNKNQACATAIIPAYNEKDHITRVLTSLSHVPQLKEIIVVDDSSTDDTASVVSAYCQQDNRLRLVSLEQNQGKGGAVMAGIQASSTDLMVLLDADLINLQPRHVNALVQPVQQRQCAMTLGIFRNGRHPTNLSHRYFSFLSGQRCLRWSAFRHAADFHDARWGIEVALNLTAWEQKLAVQRVPWDGVSHTMRWEKFSGLGKFWTYVEMWLDILRLMAAYGRKRLARNGRSSSYSRSPIIKSNSATERLK